MPHLALITNLYKKMLLIRTIELRIAEIYHTDVIKSPIHLSVGQEAIAVGVCDALAPNDLVSNTYRCHATYIAKGGDLNAMMAELYGKKDGCASGKAGSMHLVDMKHGILGASAVVGTTIPIATGYAFALQREAQQTKHQRIIAAFFGDGATEEGCFYESLNFAALHQLPILYICENNGLAIHTPVAKRWATSQLCERVKTFGIRTHQLVTDDILALHELVTNEVASMRNHPAPVFIECPTYRWLEHVGPLDDHHEPYRNQAMKQQWQANDQLLRLGQLLDEATRFAIHTEINASILNAEKFAQASPFPTAEELYRHVYAS